MNPVKSAITIFLRLKCMLLSRVWLDIRYSNKSYGLYLSNSVQNKLHTGW